jgi:hypothetical protein
VSFVVKDFWLLGQPLIPLKVLPFRQLLSAVEVQFYEVSLSAGRCPAVMKIMAFSHNGCKNVMNAPFYQP